MCVCVRACVCVCVCVCEREREEGGGSLYLPTATGGQLSEEPLGSVSISEDEAYIDSARLR